MNVHSTNQKKNVKKSLLYCYLPLMTLYVAKMCAMLLAGEVSAKPSEHRRDPAIATFRYENSFNNGPTNKPEKFIITSYVLIIMAAPSVVTFRSRNISPNNKPNDGSIALVAN